MTGLRAVTDGPAAVHGDSAPSTPLLRPSVCPYHHQRACSSSHSIAVAVARKHRIASAIMVV